MQLLGKRFGGAPKLSVELPYDPDIPFLDIASQQLEARTHQISIIPGRHEVEVTQMPIGSCVTEMQGMQSCIGQS